MRNLSAISRRHLAKRAIERARADEESGMQHRAIDLALEHAGAEQVEQAFDEHFGAAVEAGLERRRCARGRRGARGRKPPDQLAEVVVVCDGAGSALCATASPSEPMPICSVPPSGTMRGGVQPGGVIGQRDRLARRREQRKIQRRIVEQHVEFVGADRGVAAHERQFGVGLAGEQEIDAALAAQRQQVEREVGIAAQAERMRASRLRDARPAARRR